MFHDGMRELQDKYGGRKVADAIAKNRTHVEFTDDDRAYIESVPFFFLATGWGETMDCTIKAAIRASSASRAPARWNGRTMTETTCTGAWAISPLTLPWVCCS